MRFIPKAISASSVLFSPIAYIFLRSLTTPVIGRNNVLDRIYPTTRNGKATTAFIPKAEPPITAMVMLSECFKPSRSLLYHIRNLRHR